MENKNTVQAPASITLT